MFIRYKFSSLFGSLRCQYYRQSNRVKLLQRYESTTQPSAPSKRTMFSTVVLFAIHLPIVKCLEDKKIKPFELPSASDMSPKQILQQSASVATAAALQLLTLTTAAVINASTEYRHAIEAEMLLLNKSLEFVNVQFMQEDFNDTLITLRADIQRVAAELQELYGFMEYVEKLASAAAETSFLAGAEYSSFSLSDVLFSAQTQISDQKIKTQNLESELRALHQQVILRSKNPDKDDHQEMKSDETSENS